MAKIDPIGVRLESEERNALAAAAAADDRQIATMARKAIVEWLRANGWLPPKGDANA